MSPGLVGELGTVGFAGAGAETFRPTNRGDRGSLDTDILAGWVDRATEARA